MRIIPRAEWGARHANGFGSRPLPATQAWLHHSVSIAPDLVPPYSDDYAAIRHLEQVGQSRFGGGISYTRLFTPAGLIFEGHGIDRVGSHTANRNTVAVGYCLVGNYDTTAPTDAQVRAVAWCLQHDHARGWLDAPRLDGGHRDLKATACPGRHGYAAIPAINRLAAGGPVQEVDMTPDQHNMLASIHAAIFKNNAGKLEHPTQGDQSVISRLVELQVTTRALAGRPSVDVDETALATALAPLLPDLMHQLSDEDVARIARASADERDRRERERLG